MTPKDRDELFVRYCQYEMDLLTNKSISYDKNASKDVLNFFKEVAAKKNISAKLVIEVFIEAKVSRLNSLLQGTSTMYESIQDTIHDLRNYLFLLQCLIHEERSDPEKS